LDSSPEHFSSNALDIDQLFAPHQLRNRLPASLTYQEAIAGDNPAPLPAQQQQQQHEQQEQQQQQQQLQASNEVAIDDVDFFDFEGALQASRYSSIVGAARGPGQEVSGSSGSSTSQQQQQQRLSLMRQVGRPVNESMSDFPSAGLELVKHFNLDGIFLEKQVGALSKVFGVLVICCLSGILSTLRPAAFEYRNRASCGQTMLMKLDSCHGLTVLCCNLDNLVGCIALCGFLESRRLGSQTLQEHTCLLRSLPAATQQQLSADILRDARCCCCCCCCLGLACRKW
jgi:hypothetical protein